MADAIVVYDVNIKKCGKSQKAPAWSAGAMSRVHIGWVAVGVNVISWPSAPSFRACSAPAACRPAR